MSRLQVEGNLYQIIIAELQYHLITICIVFAIIITIIINRNGTLQNKKIGQKYKKVLDGILNKYFKNSSQQLIYQSPNIIKLYPSDHDYCPFAIISLALIPRQQILSFFFNWIFFKLKDEIVIEIPINNQNPLSLTAAIVQRKNIRTITKKSFPDIKQLCKQYKPVIKNNQEQQKKNVPSTHCILVERVDHVKYFLQTNRDVQIWKKYGKYVKLVYISDVNKFSRYPMAVRMVMLMNQKDNVPMIQWLMSFVQRMAKIKQNPNQRKQALKKRQTFQIKYD